MALMSTYPHSVTYPKIFPSFLLFHPTYDLRLIHASFMCIIHSWLIFTNKHHRFKVCGWQNQGLAWSLWFSLSYGLKPRLLDSLGLWLLRPTSWHSPPTLVLDSAPMRFCYLTSCEWTWHLNPNGGPMAWYVFEGLCAWFKTLIRDNWYK